MCGAFLVSDKLTLLHTIIVNVHFNVEHVEHVEQPLIYQRFQSGLTWYTRGTTWNINLVRWLAS